MTAQDSCKHRYVEYEKEDNGYWFRCVYCGLKVFGRTGKPVNAQTPAS